MVPNQYLINMFYIYYIDILLILELIFTPQDVNSVISKLFRNRISLVQATVREISQNKRWRFEIVKKETT